MAVEIEKKFLVLDDSWKEDATSKEYYQGYICSDEGRTVRIRIAGETSYITIKGKPTGISRLEYEYAIPLDEAKVLLKEVCQQPIIHKRRFFKKHDGFLWEIDEFYGENEGLILAEIELESEHQKFNKPTWLGKEVTHLSRYYNASLRTYPFKRWQEGEK